MVASFAAAKLRSEICALDLTERLNLAPGFIAYRAGHIDLESYDRHEVDSPTHGAKEKKLDLEFPGGSVVEIRPQIFCTTSNRSPRQSLIRTATMDTSILQLPDACRTALATPGSG